MSQQESHSRVRHALLAGLGRLSAPVRIPRKRAAISSTGTPARRTNRRRRATPRSGARRPAQADRRGRDRAWRWPACMPSSRTCTIFQMNYAQSQKKPVLLLRPFGSQQELPKLLTDRADEVVRLGEARHGRCHPAPGAPRKHGALRHHRVQPRRLQGLQAATEPRMRSLAVALRTASRWARLERLEHCSCAAATRGDCRPARASVANTCTTSAA